MKTPHQKLARKVTDRVHAHTVRCMIDCADHGHGCDNRRALKSATRLIEFILKLAGGER